MRKMKDSGIEWVGQIPENWKVKRNKYIMEKKKVLSLVYHGEDIISLSMQGVVVRDLDAGGKMPKTFDGYQFVYPGNLLMCLFDYDVTPRCIGIIKNYGLTSPAYSQFVLKNGNSADYYYYYYLMIDNTKEILHFAKNLRHSFTEEQLGMIDVPVPPLEEQKMIASYLDSKCSELDSLVSDIEQQITVLEEYKKSVITEAVTKGLNPDVEMKDSGIDWIGTVPKEWKVVPLKYVVLENQFSLNESCDDNFEFNYVDIGSVEYGEGIIQYQKMLFKDSPSRARRIVYENDVIISTVRTYLKAIAVIPKSDIPIIVSTGFAVLTSKEGIDSIYLGYAVQLHPFVSEIESKSFGISYPAINSSSLMNIKILVPDIISQRQIADYLDAKCSEMDSIIADKKQQLETLKEYKKSLIYEYVTGKKEVPVV